MYKLQKNLEDYSYSKINLENARVVVRSCLNVTVDSEGKMIDTTRFYESLPLIRELAQKAENIVITAHLGRPEQREQKSSFWNIAEVLRGELKNFGAEIGLNLSVELIDDLTEENINKIQNNKNNPEHKTVFLLENIRFFKGEESKDKEGRMNFAKVLASLGNTFINDAFADYRESASTYDIATLLPSFLGPVFLKEVEAITKFSIPEKPFIAVFGGAKLSEKLDTLKSIAEVADSVLIGGAMAYTLMKAKGINVGKSKVEEDKLDVAKEIIDKYSSKIILPVDHMLTHEFSETAESFYSEDYMIPNDYIAIDIGPRTTDLFTREIQRAKSILWNGPMGVFEWEHSGRGTCLVASEMVANENAYALTGGGDSIAAINQYNLKGFDHVSTGGGAMLALLAYDKFPTLDVIII